MGAKRFRAAVLASGLVASTLAASAVAADLSGTIKSVDPTAKTVVVTPRAKKGSEQSVEVRVDPQTRVESVRGEAIDLSKLAPGAPVLVREGVLATKVLVQERLKGLVRAVDTRRRTLVVSGGGTDDDLELKLGPRATITSARDEPIDLLDVEPDSLVDVVYDDGIASSIVIERGPVRGALEEVWHNFKHNLFKPLLLFFYMGFLIPIFRVKFDFPYVIYQGLTIYLLIAIGWHGGEELAGLDSSVLGRVVGFMGVGFLTNFVIGCLAFAALRMFTRLRRIDAATVAGYYGSDSAGTFVTCLGVLAATRIGYDAFMPVMLAVMEIPGCLVALYLVSRLRKRGMDASGSMPDEPGYNPDAKPTLTAEEAHQHDRDVAKEEEMALERRNGNGNGNGDGHGARGGGLSAELLHEVFLNPGIYLLFGGILVGYISRCQGPLVTKPDDPLFLDMFQGLLCLFLLEMGMTASRRLRDLRMAGWRFVLFGLLAPPVFATLGIVVAHAYSWASHQPFQLGTYVLFSVLCGAASYIAVPAVQRLAIPEASPTLPLAASLGLTFSFNVTVGIPIYIGIAKFVMTSLPVG